jgi:hypothetical protein
MGEKLENDVESIKLRAKMSYLEASEDLNRLKDRAKMEMKEVALSVGLSFHFFSWQYLSRLAFSILFFLVTGYINSLSATIGSWLGKSSSHMRF